MGLRLLAIEKRTSRKSGKEFYRLYCTDDYDHGNWLCGSPMKIVECSEKVIAKSLDGTISAIKAAEMVGKNVYVMFNEYGYTSFIKFFDDDDDKRKQPTTAGSYYDSAPPEPADDYPL